MMGLSTHPRSQEAAVLSMKEALARIKGSTETYLPDSLLRGLCRELKITFRDRLLTPLVTARLFLRQLLHGNAPVAELRRLAKAAFSESAYCEARQRLTLAFFARLQRAALGRCRPFAGPDPAALWK